MQRFLLKPDVVFRAGDISWRVIRRLSNGRIQFESDDGEIIKLEESEVWSRHAQRIWVVDADSLLETVTPHFKVLPRDASTFPTTRVAESEIRLAYLKAIEREQVTGAAKTMQTVAVEATRLGQTTLPSFRTICRWRKRYRLRTDPMDVVPRHDRKGRCSVLQGSALELLEDLTETHYLNQQQITVKDLYDNLIDEIAKKNELQGTTVKPISLSTLYRHISSLDWLAVMTARRGRKEARKKHRPVYGTLKTTRVNERWEVDHTPINVFCVCPIRNVVLGRPYLTLIIDAHSRMVMGFHIGFRVPRHEDVAAALVMATLGKQHFLNSIDLSNCQWPARGIPALLMCDNGMEFHANALRMGCYELAIELGFCPSHSPWNKGRIERFLGTIARSLFHKIPGTTFASIGERGDYDAENLSCISIQDLTRFVTKWIVEIYHDSPHRGLKQKTPRQVWDEGSRTSLIHMPADPEQLQIVFANEDERLIGNQGITFDHLNYNSPALHAIQRRIPIGEKVKFRFLDDDLNKIYVFDPRAKEYLEVPCTNLSYTNGLTRDIHGAITKSITDEGKAINSLSLARKRIAMREEIEKMYRNKKLRIRQAAARRESISSKPRNRARHDPADGEHGHSIKAVNPTTVSIPAFTVTKRSSA